MLEKIFIPQVYLPVLYIIVAVLINGTLKRIIKTIIEAKEKNLEKGSYNYKKSETLKTLINNFLKYIIAVFCILAILTVYGVDVSSVLAGLGIVGVVLGLALQDFAKDIIAGIGIVLEDQYAIGDVITVNDFTGEVTFLGLKTTRIKSWDGKVKIIANHNITEIINHNMKSSMAIVDIGVAYESNLDRVEKVLNELAKELTETLPDLKGDVKVLGIEKMDNSSIVYRITAPTKSLAHYNVQRLMRKEIKQCLEKAKIKIPYPQVEVHHGQ
ncbi:MAG: mechanosensitive ion channel family protein [Bacilli bacterium]|nr:mechanosensitive ion channel family protein [Bacilli bacterium]